MVFDIDGTCLRVPFPQGEEEEGERYRCSIRQGAYKAFERHGLVFAYMGPPDEEPPFPEWEGNFTVAEGDELVVKDANGNRLADGDSVTVIKDLKVKGSSLVVKVGTKVKNIRLVEGDHDIDCKIDGIGPMKLKSEFVRKA